MTDQADLITELKVSVKGEVREDCISRAAYSVDASIYEIEPLAVVLPLDKEDVLATVRVAARHNVPLIPRGAATGIAGGAIGRGIVLDLARHMREIIEINAHKKWVRCQPGVVQKQLNDAVASHGLRLGPDTSTGNRATIGGMIANNSCGAHALKYGQMVDHVLQVECITSDGSTLHLEKVATSDIDVKAELFTIEGSIYREIRRIREEDADEIRRRMPKRPMRASGYNLDRILGHDTINLAELVVGSEGSLGIVTETKLRLVPQLLKRTICLLSFSDLQTLFHAVNETLEYHPVACEMIDRKILHAGRSVPVTAHRSKWISGDPAGLLVVEFEGSPSQAEQLAEGMRRRGVTASIIRDDATINDIWAIREAGLGLLLSKRSYSRAIGFLEDVVVTPENLSSFMEEFLSLLHSYGKDPGVYGHAGRGAMHVRPFIDLTQSSEVRLLRELMVKTTDLLLEHGGFLSGEHGDGLVRSWLNEKVFGSQLYRSFCSLKQSFDPENRMNPGKVVGTQEVDENLRIDPETRQRGLDSQFDFSKEGGVALAVDLCNGNGACRKRDGLMCPSFQAYGDEFHSVRARAQGLRAVMNRRLPKEALTSDEMYAVMEYCLECKGCKTECPSQVDMAKLKAEFLYHYQEKHGYSFRSRIFGHVSRLNRRIAPVAPLYNIVVRSWLGRQAQRALGISPRRTLPAMARRRFSKQWKKRHSSSKPSRGKVLLFTDTFTEFNEPKNGLAAIDMLESLGFEVLRTKYRCCGRPLISKGLLKEAKQYAASLIETLWPYAKQGIPIIGLEPSCLFTIKDDLPDLIVSDMTDEVIAQCQTLDLFLEDLARKEALPWREDLAEQTVYLHTHCYQKALIGSEPTINLLKSIPGIQAHAIDAGCCGMAGSFGFEREHYEMSLAIAEDRLFPTLRKASKDAAVIANGTSCRSQIEHGSPHSAQHIVHLLKHRLSSTDSDVT